MVNPVSALKKNSINFGKKGLHYRGRESDSNEMHK